MAFMAKVITWVSITRKDFKLLAQVCLHIDTSVGMI